MKSLIKIITILSLAFLISVCDNTNNGQINFLFPEEEEVSYLQHVDPFLRLRCAFSPCHNPAYASAGYDMTDWFQVTKDQVLVNTVNVESSLLLQVMDGRNPHLVNMGLILANENQIQGVRRWIEDGAELN